MVKICKVHLVGVFEEVTDVWKCTKWKTSGHT